MAEPVHPPTLYGLVAEFDNPTELVAAANAARLEGYRRMDAYSPIPIEQLHTALGFHHTRMPLIVLIGGLIGLIGGYGLEYWASAVADSVKIGGGPPPPPPPVPPPAPSSPHPCAGPAGRPPP